PTPRPSLFPYTTLFRSQYMISFIEPFKRFFQTMGIGIVHVRSTFLIALPALIAARQLGLKVLYEVSGLWELVYQDRETDAHLLKDRKSTRLNSSHVSIS